ncbi:MAG: hypothetical protein K2W96_27110, partial [Gemmataceae bacterium]|nr:hypothetical protein [Gemmataceae bacterium]
CVLDDHGTRLVRPGRGGAHLGRVNTWLGEAGAGGPEAARANPDEMLPVAHALCREVYPDLLRPEVNAVPAWLEWLVGHPGHSRHWRGFFDWLHRSKRSLLLLLTLLLPLAATTGILLSALFDLPAWVGWMVLAGSLVAVPLGALAGWGLFTFSAVFSWRQRRMFRARKQTAAVLSVLHKLLPGGLQQLLEDDDLLSLHLQRFLNEHQVPVAPPLYGPDGRYLFASPEKAERLGKAILSATARGQDNELFVILADLLDLDEGLKPVLHAAKVARARHHQVVVVCPWPRGLALPGEETRPRRETVGHLLTGLLHDRMRASFADLRREFARLGVPVVCAASDEPVPLVLGKMERLRRAGGRR